MHSGARGTLRVIQADSNYIYSQCIVTNNHRNFGGEKLLNSFSASKENVSKFAVFSLMGYPVGLPNIQSEHQA